MNYTSDPLYGAPLSVFEGVLVWLRYAAVISPVVAVYDWFLTFDDEVRLISYL
jgi:hypothetical protein